MNVFFNGLYFKRQIGLLGCLGLIVCSGCQKAEPESAPAETPRNVRVLVLAPTSLAEYLEISGPVAPVRGTDLSAEESGAVIALPVVKGATVEAGQILVEQDRRILKAEMEAARAAVATQSYNVDKVRKLFEAGKVSRIELLNAESAYAQAEAVAEVAGQRFDRAAIRAPFAGVLADRFVELGQLVGPGMAVARVIDPYTLKLEAYLTDEQVRWVKPGQTATVVLDGLDVPTDGTVSWVGFEADRLTGKFKVELELPNPELRLRSGVIGRARLAKNVAQDVISIPRGAVLPGQTGMAAFVVKAGRAQRRELTLGAAQGLMVQVTAGLAVGDSLVVRGQRELRQDSLVRVTETSGRPDGVTGDDPALISTDGVPERGASGAAAGAEGQK